MLYRNIRTGQTVDISSVLHDKDWKPVETPASVSSDIPSAETVKKKTAPRKSKKKA